MAAGVAGGFLLAMVGFHLSAQSGFAQQNQYSLVQKTGAAAIDRLAREVGAALFNPTGGSSDLAVDPDGNWLRFREVIGGSASGSQFGAVRYYMGPHATSGFPTCGGVVLLRHVDLPPSGASSWGGVTPHDGADDSFGTADDTTGYYEDAGASPPIPNDVTNATIVPAMFAPSSGSMVHFAQSGRAITITLRLNLLVTKRTQGAQDYVFGEDAVFTRTLTLMQ